MSATLSPIPDASPPATPPEWVEGRRVIRRVSSALAEIVVVQMQPGYRSLRTTCPDGQFWLIARGEQTVERFRAGGKQRPFDLLYYAPREGAIRIAETASLAYGLRIRLSGMRPDEFDSVWNHSFRGRIGEEQAILRIVAHGLTDPLAIDEAVAELLQSSAPREQERKKALWLATMKEMIEEKPERSLLEISRAVGVAPAYASAQFSRAFGITMTGYRRKVMISKTLRFANSSTLNEAAIEAGFYDASHFHRACAAELGFTPSHLRKMMRET